jgi:DNA-binding transcriptional LysR family regulator
MLDVGRLRFFSEVVRAGSFSEAASRLSYTQSAVSQQIATLEAELGLTLIERRKRPMCLTDAGQALLRHVESIFGEVATAEAELRAIAKLDTGLLHVGGLLQRLCDRPANGRRPVPARTPGRQGDTRRDGTYGRYRGVVPAS